MVSTLYQSKIDAFQSQLAALQTKIDRLSKAQLSSESAIASVRAALQQVSEADPDEVASLKSAVVALFNSDDDGGQPITPVPISPAPQVDQLDLNGQLIEIACCLEDAPESALVGQAVEIMCPATSNVTAIYKDTCPEESLQGQAIEVACSVSFEVEPTEPQYIDLVRVTDSVGYMRRLDGEIIAVYAGGSNKGKLRNWGDWLTRTHSVTHAYEIREAKRLGTKWELKLTPMTLAQIERLAACDFSKDPRSNYPDAPKRPAERVPSMVEIEGIGVGDIVRSTTVKNWEYKVISIDSDNFLVCDRLNTNPTITQVLHPGSVELVTKADVVDVAAQELADYLEQQAQAIAPVIDPSDVPRGVILRQTSDDFIIEFNVFAWVIVRNQGVPEPQQRQIGRLVEGLGKIESYRPKAGIYHAFTHTRDAVNYLISGSGYSQANIEAGVQLFESRQQQRLLAGVGAMAHQLEDAEF